jgi:RHS repeat-associated protein
LKKFAGFLNQSWLNLVLSVFLAFVMAIACLPHAIMAQALKGGLNAPPSHSLGQAANQAVTVSTRETDLFDAAATSNTDNASDAGEALIPDNSTEPLPEPPTVLTLDSVTDITASAALLQGKIDWAGTEKAVQVYFEYRLDEAPALKSETLEMAAPGVFSIAIRDLKPESSYYFRAFALSAAGLTAGEEFSFVTSDESPLVSSPATGSDAADNSSSANSPGTTSLIDEIDQNGKFLKPVEARSEDSRVNLLIAAGTIGLTPDKEAPDKISILPVEKAMNSTGILLFSQAYELGPSGTTFSPPITLTVTGDFPASESGQPVLAYWEAASQQWIKLDSTLDKAQNTVSGFIAVLGVYAVVQPLILPDLGISEMVIDPLQAKIGEPIKVAALITNNTSDYQDFALQGVVNGDSLKDDIDYSEVIGLKAQESRTIEFSLVIDSPGSYVLNIGDQIAGFQVIDPESTPQYTREERKASIRAVAGKDTVLTSFSGKARLVIPQGAISESLDIEMVEPGTDQYPGMLNIFRFQAHTVDSREQVSRFQKDLELTIQYNPEELEGYDLESLRLYYLDQETLQWAPVESQFDNKKLVLTSRITHFSSYGAQANPLINGPGRVLSTQVNLHSGSSTFSYPFELPVGPGGFQPTLEMTYDSASVDEMKNKRDMGSWVGIGWTLNTGRISFDPINRGYYLELKGVSYRLISFDGLDYHTNPEENFKITRSGNTWTMLDRDGNSYRFGGSDASKQYLPNGIYYRWDLDYMANLNGDNATISYTQFPSGNWIRSAYPDEISYGNWKIKFNLSSTDRIDNPGSSTIPAPKVMENRQLNSIEIKTNANVLIRRYVFSYTTTACGDGYDNTTPSADYGGIYYSGKHQLDSITQYGDDGASYLPAITFTYQNLQTYRQSSEDNYTGNPGNAASFWWPHLTRIDSGYGGYLGFAYAQSPENATQNLWSRELVIQKITSSGVGPVEIDNYTYTGNPQYKGEDWSQSYCGFNEVKEIDPEGNYILHYYYTQGTQNEQDAAQLSGREYETDWYDASNILLKKILYTWTATTCGTSQTEGAYLGDYTGGSLSSPGDLAVAPDGAVYIKSTGTNRVVKYDANLSYMTSNFDNLNITSPRGITVSNDGYIYVITGSSVVRYEPSGDNATTVIANLTDGPCDVAVTDNNQNGVNYYVSFPDIHKLRKYNSAGNPVQEYNYPSNVLQDVSSPYCLAVSPAGDYLYAAVLSWYCWGSPGGVCYSYSIYLDTFFTPIDAFTRISHETIGSSNVIPKVAVASNGDVYYGYDNRLTNKTQNYTLSYGSAFTSVIAIGIGNNNIYLIENTGVSRWGRGYGNWRTTLTRVDEITGTKTKRTDYAYDDYGNLITETRRGDTSISSDDATIWRAYYPDTSLNILNKVARERVYSNITTSDSGGTYLLAETYYYYDNNTSYYTQPTKGNLTRIYKKTSASTYINSYFVYDQFGNKVAEQDPNGKTTRWTYENTCHSYPSTKTYPAFNNDVSLGESYTYYPGTDNLESMTDVNGQTTHYRYDPFKRLTRVFKPGDDPDANPNNPSLLYEYLNWGSLGSTNSQNIKTSTKIADGNYLWQADYFDGLGRVIQTMTKGENGNTLITDTSIYDHRGLVEKKYIPHDANLDSPPNPMPTGYIAPAAGWKCATYTYDALGRTTTQTNPDNTTVKNDYSTPWQTDSSNGYNAQNSFTYDAYGRLITVNNLVSDGWKTPTAYSSATVTNPANGCASDNVSASARTSGNNVIYSCFDIAAIPSGIPISGIQVRVQGYRSNTNNSFDVFLSYDGGTTYTSAKNTGTMPLTDTGIVLGGLSDNWDRTWANTDFSNNNFRVKIVWHSSALMYLDCVMVKVSYATGGVISTNYDYDDLGNLTTVTDNNGNITTLDYDWLGRKTAMSDPDMGTWTYTYDNNGNLLTQTDAKSQVITMTYDAMNRLTGKTYSTGMSPVSYTYDSGLYGKGQRTGLADGSGGAVYTYDNRGRLTSENKTISGASYITSYAYDGADRTTSITYPTGEVVRQNYNGRGLPEKLGSNVFNGDNSTNLVSSVAYNYMGAITELNMGITPLMQTTFGYYGVGGTQDTADVTGHDFGKLYEIKTVNTSNTVLQQVRHSWDANGNLTQRCDVFGKAQENFEYDYLDRLISPSLKTTVNAPGDANNDGVIDSQDFFYVEMVILGLCPATAGCDANGDSSVTLLDATRIQNWLADNYTTYDAIGNITSRQGDTYSYGDKPHAVNGLNAQKLVGADSTTSSDGNAAANKFILSRFQAGQSGTLDQIRVNCTAAGFIKVALYADNSGAPGSLKAADNVTRAVVAGWNNLIIPSFTISSGSYYWLAFNSSAALVGTKTAAGSARKYKTATFSTFSFPGEAGTGFSSDTSRYDIIAGWSNGYTYDLDGNLMKGGGREIVWDAENRPTSIVKDNVTTTFEYDGDGKRVKQTVGGTTTIYVNQYYEKTGAENTTSYYLGGKLIAIRKGETLSYVLQDHLGSTTGTVNTGGSVASTISYFSFGAVRFSTGSLPTDKKFTGQELDSTGLYYYGARYYDPVIGRFISADTIVPDPANPQSLNRYSYCFNNPLNYTDPSGNDPYMDYIRDLGNGDNPEPSNPPGSNKIFRINLTRVFVAINYVGDDSGIETLDIEDMKIPSIYVTFYNNSGQQFTHSYGGGNAPSWVGYMDLLAEAERMWFVVNSGKNIVATQQLFIEGKAIFDPRSGNTSIELTIFHYLCDSSDGGYPTYKPSINVNGEKFGQMDVVNSPQSWPACTKYSLIVSTSTIPQRIKVDLNPVYKGAGNPSLKNGYPGLEFEYE